MNAQRAGTLLTSPLKYPFELRPTKQNNKRKQLVMKHVIMVQSVHLHTGHSKHHGSLLSGP